MCVVLFAPLSQAAEPVGALQPRVFWASAPVRPDETVLVQGSDLGPNAVVEMARLGDEPTKEPGPTDIKLIRKWTAVPVLQASDESLKFAVPAAWEPGVFAYRIQVGKTVTEPKLLNQPDPWWVQGDEGEAASPGGWLRVLGKSLSGMGPAAKNLRATVRLEPEKGDPVMLMPAEATSFSLRLMVPKEVAPGRYTVRVHNGSGGAEAWQRRGQSRLSPGVSSRLRFSMCSNCMGPDATAQMRNSLIKYNQPIDRTDGILAALQKAKANGGGTVYFPAGRYKIKGAIQVPDNTVLKGEGMGVVTLWWGSGPFNLDGGGPQGRLPNKDEKVPDTLIHGRDYGIEEMSIYMPLKYVQGIVADDRFRMNKVRIRTDHAWIPTDLNQGTVARMGRNFQVTNCDIYAKGQGFVSGKYGLIANNKIMAMKTNTPLGRHVGHDRRRQSFHWHGPDRLSEHRRGWSQPLLRPQHP